MQLKQFFTDKYISVSENEVADLEYGHDSFLILENTDGVTEHPHQRPPHHTVHCMLTSVRFILMTSSRCFRYNHMGVFLKDFTEVITFSKTRMPHAHKISHPALSTHSFNKLFKLARNKTERRLFN